MEEQIVIDANIGLAIVVQLPYSADVERWMSIWAEQRMRLFVPCLWDYECVSGLRRAVSVGLLSTEQALLAVGHFERLRLEKIGPTFELNERAILWAARHKQTRAYDAQYLALADQLQSEFWTADERLWQASKSMGLKWVHWIGEAN